MMRLLGAFLIMSLMGCATPDPGASFDGHWTILGDKACLPKDDVIRLREILLRCENGSN